MKNLITIKREDFLEDANGLPTTSGSNSKSYKWYGINLSNIIQKGRSRCNLALLYFM